MDEGIRAKSWCSANIIWMILFHIFLICLVVIVAFISWPCGILTFIALASTALYVRFTKRETIQVDQKTHQGTTHAFEKALTFVNQTDELNMYRPQILCLTGNPAARPALVDFAHNITKGESLLMCGYIMLEPFTERIFTKQERVDKHFKEWMRKRDIHGEMVTVTSKDIKEGAATLLQTVGIGILKPNILMMGFKINWDTVGRENMQLINDFYAVIEYGMAKNISLAIFRNSESGLDLSEELIKYKMSETDLDVDKLMMTPDPETMKEVKFSTGPINTLECALEETRSYRSNRGEHNVPRKILNKFSKKKTRIGDIEGGNDATSGLEKARFKFSFQMAPEQLKLVNSISKFHTPIENGRIDVWWLQNQGGLMLLLPHLLTQPKSYLEGAKIRVFTRTGDGTKLSVEQQAMTSKLRMFNIDPDNLTVIDTFHQAPGKKIQEEFNRLVEPFIAESSSNRPAGYTTRQELDAAWDKTCRVLRLTELIRENSSDADLIIFALPVTRKEEVSASLYMAWLDTLSCNLPPTLMTRGNGEPIQNYVV